ncbi:hypothetical protein [Saccharothrix sp. S26]|uniref:hypothetical protein n=1 Tax=Saccharothrix sp. S26 TaxID=2907215 RepID=UPI0035AC1CC6
MNPWASPWNRCGNCSPPPNASTTPPTSTPLLPPGQLVRPYPPNGTRWAYEVYDIATREMSSNCLTIADGRGDVHSVPFRYVWPAELDLMVR